MHKRHILFIKFTIILILIFTIFSNLSFAAIDTLIEPLLSNEKEMSPINQIEDHINKYEKSDIKQIWGNFDGKSILKNALKGDFNFNITDILKNCLKYLFNEIYKNIDILLKLIVLAVICAILKNLQTSFLSESVGELAFYVCYIVIVSILIMSFNTATNLAIEIIDNMTSFMYVSIPILTTLLISSGSLVSAGIFQPLLIGMVSIVTTLLKNVFIPLAFMVTILGVVNNISDKIQLKRLTGLLKNICVVGLGIILTVFIGIISIEGAMGASVDGITSKTAKFAIGTLIPVAGKYLADAADSVIGCTLLIKNAAGITVMVGIVSICLVPLLNLAAMILLYKITAVIIEPIAEKRITDCVNEVSSSMTFVFGVVAVITFMFLLSVTAVIAASNISAMFR